MTWLQMFLLLDEEVALVFLKQLLCILLQQNA